MKNIEVVKLEISALPGSSIGDCMKDAMELAIKEWRNVLLKHNGKYYRVEPNKLITAIEEI